MSITTFRKQTLVYNKLVWKLLVMVFRFKVTVTKNIKKQQQQFPEGGILWVFFFKDILLKLLKLYL